MLCQINNSFKFFCIKYKLILLPVFARFYIIKLIMEFKNKNPKVLNLHQGHKLRLRTSLIENGWEDFSDHQILEYILSCVLVRKDTNPLAHKLIDEFGSLANVLDASVEDLMTVDGIGERTATFLHSFPYLFKEYKKSKTNAKPDVSCPKAVFNFLGEVIYHLPHEEFYVICVDSLLRVITSKQIARGTNNQVNFALKTITENAIRTQATGVVLLHNHPNGDCRPSTEDIEITKRIYLNLSLNGIYVLDHIIVGADHNYFSFANQNYFENFEKELDGMLKYNAFKNKKPNYNSKLI